MSAFDILPSAIESGTSPRSVTLPKSGVRATIVKPQLITPELIIRLKREARNAYDPRVLYQLAVRNSDLHAVNNLLSELGNNIPDLKTLVIKVALEEIGLANVGLIELILSTATGDATFDQLLILSHYMIHSKKSDLLKAMWLIYGVPDNYNIAVAYGIKLGIRCNDAEGLDDLILSCLEERNPNVMYWMAECANYCSSFVFQTIFDHYTDNIDPKLLEILEREYLKDNEILYLVYPVALIISQIKVILKPSLIQPTAEQRIQIETIHTRIPARQPVINTEKNKQYRSEIPVSELSDLIIQASNNKGLKNEFQI